MVKDIQKVLVQLFESLVYDNNQSWGGLGHKGTIGTIIWELGSGL